jgi:AraC-like DNA-binding protein
VAKDAAVQERYRMAFPAALGRLLDRPLGYIRLPALTPGHLNDLTKATTGRTASALIDAWLILEAKRLLAHADAPVAEIAADPDFPAPSSFGRLFRRHVGQSPGALRATIREKYQDHR